MTQALLQSQSHFLAFCLPTASFMPHNDSCTAGFTSNCKKLVCYCCRHAMQPTNMLPCSVGSCHNLATIGKALRTYLNLEWQRKLEETDVSSVPGGWAQKHPERKHHFEAETMPGKSAQVPRQQDYCNCGLFVLAYMDFWTHAPPDQVELCERGAWKGTNLVPLCSGIGCTSCKCLQSLTATLCHIN